MTKANEVLEIIYGDFDFLDNAKISESSLSRLLNQINSNERDFAMLTAFRGHLPKRENRKRNKKLMSKFIKPNQIGATKVIGAFKEEGQSEVGKEESFFLIRPEEMPPEKFEDLIVKMIREFDQDSALIGINGVAYELEKSGKKNKIGSPTKFGTKDLEGAFTRIKGKTFTFEGLYVPSGFSNAMAFKGNNLSYRID